MTVDAARMAALRMLAAVIVAGQPLSEAQPEATAGLRPADEARAVRLARDTLRQMARLDAALTPSLRRRPAPRVLNLLRLGTLELAEGGPAHGVVHALVDLAKSDPKMRHAAGLVNAVLRRIATQPPPLPQMPVPRLPDPLRRKLVAAWGDGAITAHEAQLLQQPPVDLTPRDGDGAGLAARIGGTELPTGSVRVGQGQISALPGYAEGEFWVQDAAAALPARALAPCPGESVLDLCAAPGGKTLQLAASGARATALDISAARLQRLRDNLRRTGLAATVVVADALAWQGALFDAVLLDAPCSATGTLRRHPDLPFLRAAADPAPLLQLQAHLIDRAVALVRPGGRLVVCTCSLLPAEGEEQATAALARHPDLVADPAAVALPGCEDFAGATGQLRVLPWLWAERGGIDGFHVAAFRKLSS